MLPGGVRAILQASLKALAHWAQALGLLRSGGGERRREAVSLERHGPDPDWGPESSSLLLCGFLQLYGCSVLRGLEEHIYRPLVLRIN